MANCGGGNEGLRWAWSLGGHGGSEGMRWVWVKLWGLGG